MTPEEAEMAEDFELRQAALEAEEWAQIELEERLAYMEDPFY